MPAPAVTSGLPPAWSSQYPGAAACGPPVGIHPVWLAASAARSVRTILATTTASSAFSWAQADSRP